MITSFDTQVQVEETIPFCPFCEKPLTGESRNGLHIECDEAFAEELDEAEAELDEPNEGHIEYALQAYYGYGSR